MSRCRDFRLPKSTFQVIRRTIATLGKTKGHVKVIQGMRKSTLPLFHLPNGVSQHWGSPQRLVIPWRVGFHKSPPCFTDRGQFGAEEAA
jgi:hypothetical protein